MNMYITLSYEWFRSVTRFDTEAEVPVFSLITFRESLSWPGFLTGWPWRSPASIYPAPLSATGEKKTTKNNMTVKYNTTQSCQG